MNYITEINKFYQRQETNPLSSNAANLWHTLMHVNNRAGWKKKFTVAVSVLCCKANLTNSTFKRARIELRDKGYIRYESQGGNRAAIYQILSSEEFNMDHSNDRDMDAEPVVNKRLEQYDREQAKKTQVLDHKAVPLLKQKETKQRTSTAAEEAIDFFQKNIGVIRPYIMEDLLLWVNDVGEPLVLTAMKRALERGKINWGYIKGILQDWVEKGIKTVEEADSEVLVFKNKQRENTFRSFKPRSEEVIPEWFHKRNEELGNPKVKRETAAEAKEREEIAKLLAAYACG